MSSPINQPTARNRTQVVKKKKREERVLSTPTTICRSVMKVRLKAVYVCVFGSDKGVLLNIQKELAVVDPTFASDVI